MHFPIISLFFIFLLLQVTFPLRIECPFGQVQVNNGKVFLSLCQRCPPGLLASSDQTQCVNVCNPQNELLVASIFNDQIKACSNACFKSKNNCNQQSCQTIKYYGKAKNTCYLHKNSNNNFINLDQGINQRLITNKCTFLTWRFPQDDSRQFQYCSNQCRSSFTSAIPASYLTQNSTNQLCQTCFEPTPFVIKSDTQQFTCGYCQPPLIANYITGNCTKPIACRGFLYKDEYSQVEICKASCPHQHQIISVADNEFTTFKCKKCSKSSVLSLDGFKCLRECPDGYDRVFETKQCYPSCLPNQLRIGFYCEERQIYLNLGDSQNIEKSCFLPSIVQINKSQFLDFGDEQESGGEMMYQVYQRTCLLDAKNCLSHQIDISIGHKRFCLNECPSLENETYNYRGNLLCQCFNRSVLNIDTMVCEACKSNKSIIVILTSGQKVCIDQNECPFTHIKAFDKNGKDKRHICVPKHLCHRYRMVQQGSCIPICEGKFVSASENFLSDSVQCVTQCDVGQFQYEEEEVNENLKPIGFCNKQCPPKMNCIFIKKDRTTIQTVRCPRQNETSNHIKQIIIEGYAMCVKQCPQYVDATDSICLEDCIFHQQQIDKENNGKCLFCQTRLKYLQINNKLEITCESPQIHLVSTESSVVNSLKDFQFQMQWLFQMEQKSLLSGKQFIAVPGMHNTKSIELIVRASKLYLKNILDSNFLKCFEEIEQINRRALFVLNQKGNPEDIEGTVGFFTKNKSYQSKKRPNKPLYYFKQINQRQQNNSPFKIPFNIAGTLNLLKGVVLIGLQEPYHEDIFLISAFSHTNVYTHTSIASFLVILTMRNNENGTLNFNNILEKFVCLKFDYKSQSYTATLPLLALNSVICSFDQTVKLIFDNHCKYIKKELCADQKANSKDETSFQGRFEQAQFSIQLFVKHKRRSEIPFL